uniref:CCHC-type domain-containing protein n=1 Tax=Chelonoidis abingdonii TaxID=106734 RepID=A0A8C0H6B5_CHEAB
MQSTKGSMPGRELPKLTSGRYQGEGCVISHTPLTMQLPVCWTCRQMGHFWRDCSGPGNMVQGNPGRARPIKSWRWPKAVRGQGACWGCQKPGHIKRHCPLRRGEGRPREMPGGPEGAMLDLERVTQAEVEIAGTPQEARTQTIILPVMEIETQTE